MGRLIDADELLEVFETAEKESWHITGIRACIENAPVIGEEECNRQELILDKLKEHGFRITKSRRLMLDIILSGECASPKEIYYEVHRRDPSIGIATVYRMVNTLEESGVISRKNMYRVVV